MHFYGWKAGLKTGMYYLRTRPAAQAIQFTVDTELLKEVKANQAKQKQPAPTKTTPAASTTIVEQPSTTVPAANADGTASKTSDGAPLTPSLTPSASAATTSTSAAFRDRGAWMT